MFKVYLLNIEKSDVLYFLGNIYKYFLKYVFLFLFIL